MNIQMVDEAPPPEVRHGIVAQQMAVYGHRLALCGLHFMGHKVERPYRTTNTEGYRHVYELKPVESIEDRPTILWVMDGIEHVFKETDDNGTKHYINISENSTARHIAADLIKHATGSEILTVDGQTGPAYWISQADIIPQKQSDWADWGTPKFAMKFPQFAQECKLARQREHAYCEAQVAAADAFHAEGGHRVFEIADRHRTAAQFIHADEAEHRWVRVSTFGKQTACPFCGAAVPTNAPKCGSCGEIINAAAYNKLKEDIGKELKGAA